MRITLEKIRSPKFKVFRSEEATLYGSKFRYLRKAVGIYAFKYHLRIEYVHKFIKDSSYQETRNKQRQESVCQYCNNNTESRDYGSHENICIRNSTQYKQWLSYFSYRYNQKLTDSIKEFYETLS